MTIRKITTTGQTALRLLSRTDQLSGSAAGPAFGRTRNVTLMASKAMRARNLAMGIGALQPAVAEIFDIARFHLVVDVFPTVRDAVASISPAAASAYDAASA